MWRESGQMTVAGMAHGNAHAEMELAARPVSSVKIVMLVALAIFECPTATATSLAATKPSVLRTILRALMDQSVRSVMDSWRQSKTSFLYTRLACDII